MPAARKSKLIFSRERYEARRGEVRLHMSHFFLRYLHDIDQAFAGDLALAIVLGEISHHNTARFFSPDQAISEPLHRLQDDPSRWERMDGCNAYSISCATGIPRETVRRKVARLKTFGWVEGAPQGLRITQACVDHFGADYSLRFLDGLLRASRNIEALLAREPEAAPNSSRFASPSPRRRGPGRTSPKSRPQSKSQNRTS